MESISMHHGISSSKLKNLILTASIVSLFVMKPDEVKAQSLDRNKQGTEYYNKHLRMFPLPQKDINTEFPGREHYFLSLIHPQHKEKTTPTQQIEHKTQVSPLSFTKRKLHKYFPEREACFKEIISRIEEDPTLTQELNAILSKTVMKPRMVHRETNRRPRTEKDMIGADMMFIEGIIGRSNFAQAIDTKDNVDEYRSDSITYEQRLNKIDRCEIAPEMIEAVLEADAKYKAFIDQYITENKEPIAKSDSITASR